MVVAAQAWFSFELLRHDGRLFLPSDQSEEAQSELPSPGPWPGSMAPSFSLTNAKAEDGAEPGLGRGKPVVLVFSDPLCGPCLARLPEVRGARQGLRVAPAVGVLGRGSAEATPSAGSDPAMLSLVDDEDASTWSTYGRERAGRRRTGPDGPWTVTTVMGATAIHQMIHQTVISFPAGPEPVPTGAVHGGVDVHAAAKTGKPPGRRTNSRPWSLSWWPASRYIRIARRSSQGRIPRDSAQWARKFRRHDGRGRSPAARHGSRHRDHVTGEHAAVPISEYGKHPKQRARRFRHWTA